MIDPLLGTLLVVALPLMATVFLFYLKRNGQIRRREWYFLLGFISITTYFVYAPAPEVVYSNYAQSGNYGPILTFSIFATGALFIAVYFFKRHLGGQA